MKKLSAIFSKSFKINLCKLDFSPAKHRVLELGFVIHVPKCSHNAQNCAYVRF